MRSFKLSFHGKLSCTLSLALLGGMTAAVSHANQQIVGGGTHAPSAITTAPNGAAVITIARPSAEGLSHNTYDKYNVDTAGAVLNNAVQDGKSVLAGELKANPNLSDNQAAKVILNEVVSRNPSLLLGQQEVFGMAADYVLANPNGITCDGCGFINVPRASMVVGSAEIEQGKIKNLRTASQGNNNSLTIKEKGISGSDVLDLVAPKITASGKIQAKQEINSYTGHNTVDYESKKVTNRHNREVGLDAYYLGGMQAGRINLVSTGAGNGVNLSGDIQTTTNDGLNVNAVSVINFVAADIKGNVKAIGQDVNLDGKLQETAEHTERDGNYSAYYGASKKRNDQELQQWKNTHIQGDKVVLAAKNAVNAKAATVQAKSLQLVGRKVDLTTQKVQTKETEIDHNWKHSWEYNQTKVRHNERQEGNRFRADDVSIRATAYDLNVSGSLIEGREKLSLKADRGSVITRGSVEKQTSVDVGNKRNHTAALETGSWNITREQDHLHKTELASDGKIGISAAKNVALNGTDINGSDDILLHANGKVIIGSQQINNNKVVRDNQTYWGGIGGGHDKNNNHSDKLHIASEINAKGIVVVSGDQGVQVTGSHITADKGGYAQASQGTVRVDNATDFSHNVIDQRNGTVFNITKDSQSINETAESVKQSELVSKAKFDLLAKQNIDVIGSVVKVAEQLNLRAVGNINIAAAQQNLDRQSKTTELKGTAYAKQDGDKQYRAGVGLEINSKVEARSETNHVASSVQGGSLNIDSKQDVNIKGSQLKTDNGDATINADNIHITAQNNTAVVNSESRTAGFGVYVGGGMDRVTVGLESRFNKTNVEKESKTALESSSEISGNLNLNAKNTLQYEGGRHQIDGSLNETANSIQRQAASDSEKSTTTTVSFNHDVGTGIELSGVTRPIEKTVNNLADGSPVTAFSSISSIGAPNANVTMKFSGGKKVENLDSSQAKATQIEAGSVNATADRIHDQATRYQATDGKITLNAQDYANVAAENRKTVTISEDKGEASIGVATSTGKDITVTAKGKGGHSDSREYSSETVVGGFKAVDNIDINAAKGITLEGNQIHSNNGGFSLNSNGDVKLVQANNIKESSKNGFNLDVSVSAGMSKSSKSGSGGLGGGANKQDSQSIVATAGEIAAKNVNLKGKNVVLQGTGGKVGNLTLQADESAVISAAQGSSHDQGLDWSVGIGGGGGSTSGDKPAQNGSLKLNLSVKKTDQAAVNYQATELNAENVQITANGKADNAIHIAGGKLNGSAVDLTAKNGGIVLESRTSSEHKDNRSVSLGGNGSLKKVSGEDKTTQDGTATLSIALDSKEKADQINSQINGTTVALTSGGNVTLAGANVKADRVDTNIGGNLTVESRKTSEQSVSFNLDLNATNTQNNGALTSAMKVVPSTEKTDAIKGKITGAVNSAAEDAGFAKHNPLTGKTPKPSSLTVSGSLVQQDEVVNASGIHAGELNVKVKDHLQLNGATLTSDNRPNVQSASVGVKDIEGYNNRYQGEAMISNNIPLLIQEGVKDLKDGKFPLISGSISQQSNTATSEIKEIGKR